MATIGIVEATVGVELQALRARTPSPFILDVRSALEFGQ